MTRSAKILLSLVLVIVVVIVLGFAGYAWWTRSDRLDEAQCHDLVLQAWNRAQEGTPDGERELEYQLGERRYRVRTDLGSSDKYPIIEAVLGRMFPRAEANDEFFDRLRIRHMGRTRAAGVSCERIRLSPSEYRGDSIELWIDPGNGNTLGWRRLTPDGEFVRGYQFRRVTGFSERGDEELPVEMVEEFTEISPLLGGRELLPPEEVREIVRHRGLALPEWVPPGFRLTGGRWLGAFDPPRELEGFLPGLGIGRMRRGAEGVPGPIAGDEGQMQMIYSDGLNTISIVQLAHHRLLAVDPARIESILNAKAGEVRRIFRTAMVGRFRPPGVVLLFGEVSQEVLEQVAASIPASQVRPFQGIGPMGPGPEGFIPPGQDRPRMFGPRGRPGNGPPEGPE